ncbi:unnamed protein product [Rodentolepis nana]|uniref:Uncharacterized protein n=1 Tax=Rodentolepis nana TaxID=102285 RepID=A0A0R3TFK8_RODNA|nr:unnamed protein product [Rodentolepis nana]
MFQEPHVIRASRYEVYKLWRKSFCTSLPWSLDLGLGSPPTVGLSVLVWVMIFMVGSVLVISFGLLTFLFVLRFCLRWSPSSDNYERALLSDHENEAEADDLLT